LGEAYARIEENFVAGDTSPSLAVQRNEQICIMMAAIQRLPDNQRTAIIMKHLRGHKLREVAEILGLSESATAGLLHRGRLQLVQWLQDANHE
ncbi:MAG: sigma factor-like helix-turn-helix DNA-binding protein, partial [Pirellulaceae bacterium]|nr:sigma factor-like helix-turn-helix DNA-binding protein [Pirellulaceae bacterium]